jgi:hypothetical protein
LTIFRNNYKNYDFAVKITSSCVYSVWHMEVGDKIWILWVNLPYFLVCKTAYSNVAQKILLLLKWCSGGEKDSLISAP